MLNLDFDTFYTPPTLITEPLSASNTEKHIDVYPFKTDKQTFQVNSSKKTIENILTKSIQSKKLIQIRYSDSFYGKVSQDKATFELGQFPNKNAWRPIVKMSWQTKNNKTELNIYYKLDNLIVFGLLVLPLFGLSLSNSSRTKIPFILTSTIYLFIIFIVSRFIYNRSKRKTTEKLNEILKNIS